MVSKTITITLEAYDRLALHKGPDESFTDVILKLTERRPLSHFAGILSEETGEEMMKAIRDSRRSIGQDYR